MADHKWERTHMDVYGSVWFECPICEYQGVADVSGNIQVIYDDNLYVVDKNLSCDECLASNVHEA